MTGGRVQPIRIGMAAFGFRPFENSAQGWRDRGRDSTVDPCTGMAIQLWPRTFGFERGSAPHRDGGMSRPVLGPAKAVAYARRDDGGPFSGDKNDGVPPRA